MKNISAETNFQNNNSNKKIISQKTEIPIQNIYYMLSYAYNNLKINQDVLRESIYYENIYELFARILIEAVNNLVRRGFYKEYKLLNEDTFNIRGKINISESIKRQTNLDKKLNCQYDEFTSDVLFNQIIKTTIDKLICKNSLNYELKKDIKKLRPFFDNVKNTKLNKQIFKSLIWHKNNQYYSLPINICELIFLMKLPDDNNIGKIHFKDFVQKHEKELANLFEKFIFNFYKKELDNIDVNRSKINWDLDDNYIGEKGAEFLPKMRTDIVLECEDKQLIIDTKFYKKILSKFHEKSMLHSPNLYQIHAYVNNSSFSGEKKGMLLYASLVEDLDYQFKIKDNLIFIRTIDLNQDWQSIEKRLKEIANLLFI